MLSVTNIGDNSAGNIDQQKKEQPKIITNIIEINNTAPQSNDQQIMVNFNEQECKFALHNKNKILMGSFTALQLIKYIGVKLCTTFLDSIEYQSAIGIIEKYICTVSNVDGFVKINLLDQLSSPFMGNIEMIMKLYQGIGNFDTKQLTNELNKIQDDKLKNKVSGLIKQLIYLLLNHALRLIANISDVIKNDPSKKEIKDMLMKYSVVIVYKMSNFMKNEIETKANEYKLLQDDLVRMGKVKIEMHKKITEIQTSLQEQNNQLVSISAKMDNSSMYGGKHVTSSTSKTTNTSSSSTQEKLISISTTEEQSESESGTDSQTESSSNSSKSLTSETSEIKLDKNKHELFSNSDCYFTESGDGININYLSTTDQQNTKSIVSEIQDLKLKKKK